MRSSREALPASYSKGVILGVKEVWPVIVN